MERRRESPHGSDGLWTPVSEDEFTSSGTRSRATVLTHLRSTWIHSSFASLREQGVYDAYLQKVDPRQLEKLLCLGPAEWVPVWLAASHYEAIDKLGLPSARVIAMGRAAVARANRSELRLATGGHAATPLELLHLAKQLWKRTCRGGRILVQPIGERGAEVVVEGYSLSRFTYCRLGWRGIVLGVLDHGSQRCHVHEAADPMPEGAIAFRVQWT